MSSKQASRDMNRGTGEQRKGKKKKVDVYLGLPRIIAKHHQPDTFNHIQHVVIQIHANIGNSFSLFSFLNPYTFDFILFHFE